MEDVIIDLRGLEPPEPMERVLTALSTLPNGQRLVILMPRKPVPLYKILDRNGYSHSTVMRGEKILRKDDDEARGHDAAKERKRVVRRTMGHSDPSALHRPSRRSFVVPGPAGHGAS